MSVAEDYPARREVDSRGERVWFKAAVRDKSETWGWTADPAQAHPDYQVKIGDDGTLVSWVGDPWAYPEKPSPTITTTEETPMPRAKAAAPPAEPAPPDEAAFDTAGDEPRFTQWMRYPLPPAPPRASVTYDGYGRYKLPSPSTGRPTGFSRATTIAKTLEETYNLSRWSRRQAIKAIVAAIDAEAAVPAAQAAPEDAFDVAGGQSVVDVLAAVREAISAQDDRKLDAAVDLLDNLTGGADARELGEAVHAWLEAVDIGTVLPWQVPEMFVPYVVAARDALRRAGLVACPEYVERIVLNDRGDETVVGTIDRIYRVVTTGELIMGDVKTSKTLEYSWLPYSVQVGGVYGYATKMFRADGDIEQGQHGWEPMPQVGQKFAVILHVPSDQPERSSVVTIDMYFGGESMIASIDARQRRSNAKKKVPFVHEIPVPSKEALRYVEARDAVLDVTDPAQLAGLYNTYESVWTDDLTELGMHVAQLIDAAAISAP